MIETTLHFMDHDGPDGPDGQKMLLQKNQLLCLSGALHNPAVLLITLSFEKNGIFMDHVDKIDKMDFSVLRQKNKIVHQVHQVHQVHLKHRLHI